MLKCSGRLAKRCREQCRGRDRNINKVLPQKVMRPRDIYKAGHDGVIDLSEGEDVISCLFSTLW